MHGIFGFTLRKLSPTSLFKINEDIWRVYCLYFVGFLINEDIWRVYCLYFVGFLDLFGVSMLLPLITHRARELGASPSTVGAIGSIYGALQLFSSPLMGRLSDMLGRKSILLLTLLISAGGYFSLGLPTTLLFLALSRVPTGIFKHSQSVSKTFLADITATVEHPKVFGNFNAFSSLGFSVGPLIGGHLAMQSNGFCKVSVLTAGVFALNFLFVWLFVEPVGPIKAQNLPGRENEQATGTQGEIVTDITPDNKEVLKRGFKQENKMQSTETAETCNKAPSSSASSIFKIASISSVLDLILIRFLMGFSMLMFRSNFTSMLEFHFGTSPKTNGYILSYNGLVSGFCGRLVGPLSSLYNHNDSKMLLHFSMILALSLLGITFSPNILFVAGFILPLALSTAVSRVCVTNLTFRRGDEDEKGVLLGIGNSTLSFARMISPALGGLAMEVSVYGPGSIGAFIAGTGIVIMILCPQDRPLKKSKTC